MNKKAQWSKLAGIILLVIVCFIILTAFFGGPKALLTKTANKFSEWADSFFYKLKKDKEISQEQRPTLPSDVERNFDTWRAQLVITDEMKKKVENPNFKGCFISAPIPQEVKEYPMQITNDGSTILYMNNKDPKRAQIVKESALPNKICILKGYRKDVDQFIKVSDHPNVVMLSQAKISYQNTKLNDQGLFLVDKGKEICFVPVYSDGFGIFDNDCDDTPSDKVGIDTDCLNELKSSLGMC